MSANREPVQARMVAACETWLEWCATNGTDPLTASVKELRCAVLELRSSGRSEIEVVDVVDQVGFMTGLWRDREWLDLRRSV